jgi:hypothetical protein
MPSPSEPCRPATGGGAFSRSDDHAAAPTEFPPFDDLALETQAALLEVARALKQAAARRVARKRGDGTAA